MREVLFRGKREDNGEWVYGNLHIQKDLKKDKVEEVFIYSQGVTIKGVGEKIIPETVGQFTGLTDKNGKRIFEGDIVEIDYFNLKQSKWTRIKGFVEFDFGRFYIENKGNFYSANSFEHGEVIGNIHDNPELLEIIE